MSKFIWYDLMTPNMQKVAAFYADVVGWKIADSGMPGMNYSIISAGDVMVGGMMAPPAGQENMNPPWQGHIYSPDVDADCKRVLSLAGHVHQQPEDIPGIGRFAVVSDPGGASFILFKPNSTEQPKPVPEGTSGHIGWRELHAADGEKAWAFYSQMFGWQKSRDFDMGAIGVYRIFTAGEGPDIGGMMTKMKDTPNPTWLYYFNVDAATAAAARVKQAGGAVLMGPHQVPTGQWIVQATDVQGHMFGLLSNHP